ncbi:MAG: histidine phosphotransferase family protein [Paracoccaceae bacterium]
MPTETSASNDLASAISSRICHDLVSPVGAVVNGIDLMKEIGAIGLEDEIAMIGQSADRASGLLQFYRIAFGSAAQDAQPLSRALLRNQARSMINWQRVSLAWEEADGPSLSRGEAKLLCLLLLCARGVTGMSGVIEVGLESNATCPLHVSVVSAGTTDTDARLEMLSGSVGTEAATAQSVEYFLARATAMELGLKLHTARTAERITMMATQS